MILISCVHFGICKWWMVMSYLSTQCAAVMAQFSFNKAAPHLCKYVDVRHWRSDICHGQRPKAALEPPTILGSGNMRFPQTAITSNVVFIRGVIIVWFFTAIMNYYLNTNLFLLRFFLRMDYSISNQFQQYNSQFETLFCSTKKKQLVRWWILHEFWMEIIRNILQTKYSNFWCSKSIKFAFSHSLKYTIYG